MLLAAADNMASPILAALVKQPLSFESDSIRSEAGYGQDSRRLDVGERKQRLTIFFNNNKGYLSDNSVVAAEDVARKVACSRKPQELQYHAHLSVTHRGRGILLFEE